MNANIIPVNNDALSRALVAVVGEQTAAVIVKSYQELDKAMADGYKAGFEAGRTAGFQEAVDMIDVEACEQIAYDDGYVDGVSDARVFPADADAYVAQLVSEDQAYDFSDLEPKLNASVEGAAWEARQNALGMAQLQY